jgi:hypothetical protein
MKKVSHPVEPRICYRKANPLYLANNQIQAKYIELGDKAVECTFFQSVFWIIAFGEDGFRFSPLYSMF